MRRNVSSCMHVVEEDSCVYNSRVKICIAEQKYTKYKSGYYRRGSGTQATICCKLANFDKSKSRQQKQVPSTPIRNVLQVT